MELKVSEVDNINKFIETVRNAYKDKNKTDDKLFYEIWNDKEERLGAARKGLILESIQKELIALGEGSYSLRDDQTKVEVVVSNPDAKKDSGKKAAKVDSSKKINKDEANMSDRGMMDVMKENGKSAMDKALHGAQVKIANKAFDTILTKMYIKSGRNEVFGMAIADPAVRALIKGAIAFGIGTIAHEKEFAGSEYLEKVSGLIIEGAGGELVEPLIDMVMPFVGDLVAAGKEIGEVKIDSLLQGSNKDADIDEKEMAEAEEQLRNLAKKKEEKVATA